MNPILECIFRGEYAEGWEHFSRLEAPAAEDLRWAGVCAFNLQRFQQAKNLLLEAHGMGLGEAAIELSTTYRHLNQPGLAEATLAALDLESTTPFDRCLALRELGAFRFTVGQLRQAVGALEEAWAVSYQTPLGAHLRPFIGQSLGFAYGDLGMDRKAGDYLGMALDGANPAKRLYIRLNQVLSWAKLGRFDEAEAALREAVAATGNVPAVKPFLAYCQGVLEWERGRLREAVLALDACVELSRAADEPETECYARLVLAAVSTALGRGERATEHLLRARQLTDNPKARAYLALREGAVACLTRPAAATEQLRGAREQLEKLELWREAAASSLHMAEAALRLGDAKAAKAALTEALLTARRLEGLEGLRAELRHLRLVRAHLDRQPGGSAFRELMAVLSTTTTADATLVELEVLGGVSLKLNGKPVALQLRKAPLLLFYLLRNEETLKDQLLLDLFPDEHDQKARSYFHQVRYALSSAIPGLDIPFDRMRRSYRLRAEGFRLWCDAHELMESLESGGPERMAQARELYKGQLLPGFDGEWVEGERSRLNRRMIRVGVETIESWFQEGEYDKCLRLAAFLMEIEPGDDVLMAYLERAGHHIRDHAAGRRVVDELARQLEADLGEVPPAVAELRQRMRRVRLN
ncbi:BTAD domain-containing putative transcriptional regulator [uncultured Meiothermus sp.]|uniref:BTAD domain-containing putative transcriptional regulator n=1 Tax=uncultured Meiothermus sp. TaxID=157471 RepID=UPI00260D3391|nr:BTAD domain-containing putative transcriptional regulator [uncultured Meiothermus sp.]